MAPEPAQPRDPGQRYEVDVCGHCHHPGGQHVWGHGCRLCPDCPGWDEATRMRGWWSDQQTAELLEAMAAIGHPAEPPRVPVTITLSAESVALLSVLIDPAYSLDSLEDVIGRLLSHARDGILRPASWERNWLVSVFATDWIGRLERDPKVPHHDRPKRTEGGR